MYEELGKVAALYMDTAKKYEIETGKELSFLDFFRGNY